MRAKCGFESEQARIEIAEALKAATINKDEYAGSVREGDDHLFVCWNGVRWLCV